MSADAKRQAFIGALLASSLTRFEQFLGLVWFDTGGNLKDQSIEGVVADLVDHGMPRPNPTRLRDHIKKSKYLVRGRNEGTIRLVSRYVNDLGEGYAPYSGGVTKPPKVLDEFLPLDTLPPNRRYLVRLAEQLNGCYHLQYFDGAAVLARRAVESLLIEVYVAAGRESDIKTPHNSFFMLDKLLNYFSGDTSFSKGRNLVAYLADIKSVGDTAAHDRTYITHKQDLDDLRFGFRRAVAELVKHAGL